VNRFLARHRRPLGALAVAGVLALTAAACSSNDADDANDVPTIEAAFASYDVSAGAQQRVIVGLFTNDNEIVAFGSIDLTFVSPSDDTTTVSADFLPVPGTRTQSGSARLVRPSEGNGVYGTEFRFDEPGPWTVRASFDLQGETIEAETSFLVNDTHQVLAFGDAAPTAGNWIIGDDVANHAIDSRAIGDQPIPDPELHDTRIASVLGNGKPLMVVVSTPVYCVSQFCGPITDEVAKLQAEFGDRMEFVHLEVWSDFESRTVNESVVSWIFPRDNSEPREPWVFLVDGAGTVVDRWDNVASTDEMRDAIEALLGN